jgi:hypothetical protein
MNVNFLMDAEGEKNKNVSGISITNVEATLSLWIQVGS